MDTKLEPPKSDLLSVANMAFGVVSAFRKGVPPDDLAENVEWLEHALSQAFPQGDPFVPAVSVEGKNG